VIEASAKASSATARTMVSLPITWNREGT
jgi:hypothetical protein